MGRAEAGSKTAAKTGGPKTGGGENSVIRERRRQQLIESTMDAIAKRGFSETTLGDVAKGAKLSHGIVNFHFKSKDQLLVETLRAVTEEYRSVWIRAVERAGPGVADKLAALYLADLDPAVCTRKKIAVWYGFYGEAKARPTYRTICGASDQERIDAGVALVGQMIAEGGYRQLDAEQTARGLDAMTDGIWLSVLLTSGKFDRDGARATVRAFLASLFPKHFRVSPETVAGEKVAGEAAA